MQDKLTHDEDWREYIEGYRQKPVQSVNDILWDLEGRRHGESEWHFKRKVVIADIFSVLGYTDIELEYEVRDGLRFDVYSVAPNGQPVAAEVGDLNTPTRKLVNRFRDTYEHTDVLLWWTRGHIPEMKYIEELETPTRNAGRRFYCEYCIENGNHSGVGFWRPWPWQIPEEPHINMFNLFHYFEPGQYHSELTEFQDSNRERERLSTDPTNLSDY